MNSGFSILKLFGAVVFVVVCFLLVMEKSNINKTAEMTGMDDVIAQTKKDFDNVTDSFKLNENKYDTSLGQVFKREYSGFTLYISCYHRGPLYGFMTLEKDLGNLPREDRFSIDKMVPKNCRQISTSSYNRDWHRGHLFAANHFDNNEKQMFESFFMSNIIPQHRVSNIGAWKKTEVITECYREHHKIYLAAGVLYGSDQSDDYFIDSHGVTTPTALWKFIQLDNDKYSAWIVPNTDEATKDILSSYEVPIDDLMRITNIKIVKNSKRLRRVHLDVFKNCHTS